MSKFNNNKISHTWIIEDAENRYTIKFFFTNVMSGKGALKIVAHQRTLITVLWFFDLRTV